MKQPTSYNFFVKTLPTGSEQRKFMIETNLFRKEATIYTDILSRMSSIGSTCAAKSYFARDDILVLEDLTLKGYKLMPERTNFSQKHVQIVLKTLANLHAMSINFEKTTLKDSMDKIYDKTLFEAIIDSDNTWFQTGLKTIEMIALNRSKCGRDPVMCKLIKDQLLKGFEKIYDLVRKPPSQYRKVLCHRDIWRNNLMFQFKEPTNDYSEPIDCVLVDFQLARCVPPAVDIIVTLYLLQQTNERKRDFLDNLKHYYDCLGMSLKHFEMDVQEILPFDEIVESCEHFKLLGALIKAIYIQTTYFPCEEMKKLRSDDEKYKDFVNNDRSILLKFIDTDKIFRDWMLEAVEELVEMILLDKTVERQNNNE